ncbi:MAG: FAD-binding oxidoreductase [Hyphomicrobiaceae bacterium]|nr:FAD-binding oxidoreductase [Hyphomicrobiaceae bacterium]
MDILTVNDRPGHYPPSFYAATADLLNPFPRAEGEIDADVCVIGGGFTGLSAALHLARRGFRTVLLEASRVGSGASGRNGGQVGTGQRLEQTDLEPMVGQERARALWDLGLESVALVKSLADEASADCEWVPGIIHADHRARYTRHSRRIVEHMAEHYGYDQMRFLDRDAIRAEIGSADYVSGVLDLGGAQVHPLKYALALARLATDFGVQILENSRAIEIEPGKKVVVKTGSATIRADFLILGLNGYHNNIDTRLAARVMPINNFIAVTEPLGGERAKSLIANDYAVADSRFVINYFRLSRDNRMVFGGGESYGYRFPRDIGAKVRKPMLQVFPQLADTRIDYAWGGTLGITMSRLPQFEKLSGNILSLSGFSGHGVAMATLAGRIASEAIAGQAERFDLFAQLPNPRFPGGILLRTPLLAAAMVWFSLRDRV